MSAIFPPIFVSVDDVASAAFASLISLRRSIQSGFVQATQRTKRKRKVINCVFLTGHAKKVRKERNERKKIYATNPTDATANAQKLEAVLQPISLSCDVAYVA